MTATPTTATPTTTSNDNTPRPAWYDDKLVSYMPFARKLAARLAPDDDAEDVVQDFYVEACRRWSTYDERYQFGTWVFQVVRNVVWNRRRYRRAEKRGARVDSIDAVVRMDRGGAAESFVTKHRALSVAPRQDDYVELSAVLGQLSGRGGGVLLRRAMGDTLQDIAGEMGVSRERVRQIEESARGKLVRGVGG